MSTVGLFLAGCVVSLLACGGVGLLVYAAVLDGRYDRERREHRLDVIHNPDGEPELGRVA